ncbi:MAG: hypothetical protein GX957_03815, partial [Clostridiaceae bacterium]|nr:hypothetical protein [Clostridiaceae bacterium]
MLNRFSIRKRLLIPITILLTIYIMNLCFVFITYNGLFKRVIRNYERLTHNVAVLFTSYIENIWFTEELAGNYINEIISKTENFEDSEYLKLITT